MAKLINKLKRLLEMEFAGAEVELHQLKPSRRVGGSLIWDGFSGKAQVDRQIQLRRVIDGGCTPEERLDVSLILTLTSDEAASLSQD